MNTQPGEALVVFDNVVKTFADTVAVEKLNLEIHKGEFVAIMGSSGCGKTTTLRMLAGLEQPSEGEVRLDGKRMNEVSAYARDTPMVWQTLALFPFMNVRKNVEFGLKMRGMSAPNRHRKAMDWLERMDIAELATRDISQLSGGQRQRVALARALVTEPEILLLDEPLSALDANLVVRMQGVLSRLQKELGITFVYVTHSQSEAFAMADRVVIMSKGRVEQIGTPRAVYRSPVNRFVAEFVGTNNIISGEVSSVDNDYARLDTPVGSFHTLCNPDVQLQTGMTVSFVISAEHVLLNTVDDKHNQLEVNLISEEFIGSVVTLHFEARDGSEFRVQKQQREIEALDLEIGANVRVSWDAKHAFILPGG